MHGYLPLWLVLIYVYAQVVFSVKDPVEFVNLKAGSYTNGRSFSTGNTLPLVGLPWGFNHWAPQTQRQDNRGTSWWFDGNQHAFSWIRCTHQPSPWIGDWGWFLFAPFVGGMDMNPTAWWEPRAAVVKPHLIDAHLADVSFIIIYLLCFLLLFYFAVHVMLQFLIYIIRSSFLRA
jgi:putative alpha-1,2-mannosidase